MAIWGVGAVGVGLASALARDDAPLSLVGRDPATLDAIARHGIHREGLLGEARVAPEWLRLSDRPESLADDPPDWLLVCTKAYSSADVADRLRPLASALDPSTRLVLCQNGWGNEAPFLSFWPRERLLHARIITGFHRLSAHRVEITAHAAPIAIGHLDAVPVPAAEALATRIDEGGLPAEVRSDMERILWAKMLYNCALNPLGALTNRRYGELAEATPTRETMRRVVEEIFDVLARSGHRVDWPDADAYLETFYAELIPPTAGHASSMLQDLQAGRRTEVESLLGAVERLAVAHDVATPVVSALATLVRAAEGKAER